VFDDAVPGLAVRVAAGGGKTFLAQYTQAGASAGSRSAAGAR
jgi:hypothetical protein